MRLIDADKLGIGKANPDVFENKAYANGWNSAIEIVDAAPTVDAVPVVRCKDCMYCRPYFSGGIYCVHSEGLSSQASDAFCSYGVRKDTVSE